MTRGAIAWLAGNHARGACISRAPFAEVNAMTRSLAIILSFAAALLIRVPAEAADESKLAGLEPFIGNWQFSDEYLAQNEWAKDFHAQTLQWGPRRNIVRLRETAHKANPDRAVFEGFAYWHPATDELRYTGYNVQERFLFEGKYVEVTPELLVTEYKVYYPRGFAHTVFSEVKGDVREFREERRLVDPDTMELSVWFRVEGEWRRWPSAHAKPFVSTRAR